MALTPTWYDVLGVPRDATPEEIKAAWRQATDRFEPGSGGQFRTFSEAADILLDPEKRREYDATLETTDTAAADPAGPEELPATHAVPLTERERRTARSAETGPAQETELEPAPEPSPAEAATGPASRGLLVGTLVGVFVLALVIAAGVVLGIKVHQRAAVLDARTEAPPAAEAAIKVLFSYDYRNLNDERAKLGAYMTPAFGKDYLKAFDALIKQKDGSPGMALQTKAVVTATVLGSGVVDADDGTARVLLYVNLLRKQGTGQPTLFQNRVAATMQKTGDRWLVSKVTTY